MNFDFVTTRLAVGSSIETPEDVDRLIAAGITAVLNLDDSRDDAPLFEGREGITYKWNGTPDDGQPKPTSWFAMSLGFTLPLMQQPGKILFHCRGGFNRSPSTLYCHLRADPGLSPFYAHWLIDTHRPIDTFGTRYSADAERALKELGYS